MSRTLATLVLGATLMCATSPAAAQTTTSPDPATTPSSDPLIASLQRQKAIADLEKAIAEAKKMQRAASLPVTEGSGVAGTATFGEKSGYFAELLAYAAAAQSAAEVAKKVGKAPSPDRKVLIVANADLAGQAQRWEIARVRLEDATQRLAELDRRLDPSAPQAEAAAFLAAGITTAAALLGAAADIGSFFRSDFTATAKATNVTATALTAETARRLRDEDWTPILPAVSLAKTKLIGHVETLLAARHRLVDRRRQLEQAARPELAELGRLRLGLAAAKADLATAKAANGDVATLQAAERKVLDLEVEIEPLALEEARWQRTAAEIDAALAAADVLVEALVEGAEGKPSPLESVALVDVLQSNLDDELQPADDLRILQLELSSQGGEMHVTKSIGRTRVTYIGGVAVTYLLMDKQGGVVGSGFVTVPVTRSVRVSKVPTLTLPEVRSPAPR